MPDGAESTCVYSNKKPSFFIFLITASTISAVVVSILEGFILEVVPDHNNLFCSRQSKQSCANSRRIYLFIFNILKIFERDGVS